MPIIEIKEDGDKKYIEVKTIKDPNEESEKEPGKKKFAPGEKRPDETVFMTTRFGDLPGEKTQAEIDKEDDLKPADKLIEELRAKIKDLEKDKQTLTI